MVFGKGTKKLHLKNKAPSYVSWILMVFSVDDVRDSEGYLLVKYSDHCSHSFAHGTSFGGLKQIHGSMSIRSSSSLHFTLYTIQFFMLEG